MGTLGHFEGTNIGYMGIYCHICIRNVPPSFAGGFMGAKPPECPSSPPYKDRRRKDLGIVAVASKFPPASVNLLYSMCNGRVAGLPLLVIIAM